MSDRVTVHAEMERVVEKPRGSGWLMVRTQASQSAGPPGGRRWRGLTAGSREAHTQPPYATVQYRGPQHTKPIACQQ